ncbi:hypothetical protein WICPIJ_000812 [Wickerhamomyces pijperi]|uniref:Uncharacterized protein n=1 Tax=Wickerhamomyces pijperi TaxID=599730 RepID=A0A9P8QEW4_WICPI|nr:hypothetical protein WICPIJ_000812 [Wickerhamomyces pijperi]
MATEEDEEPLADTKLEAGAMVLKLDDSTEAEEETAEEVGLDEEETLEDGLTIEVESLTEAELDSLWEALEEEAGSDSDLETEVELDLTDDSDLELEADFD